MYHIRWMIKRDMPEVMEIEDECFEFPWSEDNFLRVLREKNVIGMVAEWRDNVVGFMIYALYPKRIEVLSFAVGWQWRRQGVGRAMVEKLKAKLSMQRRGRLVLQVRETNVEAQLFFREMGFVATGVVEDAFDDSSEDAYRFEFCIDQEARVCS